MRLIFRRLEANQVNQLVALHRLAFPPEEVRTTIFGSYGVASYLAMLITCPRPFNKHSLWGAWDGNQLVGYAHFKIRGGSCHLNQIAVNPEYRQCGIGSTLFRHFIEGGQQQGCVQFTLDVHANNLDVISWYKRQGFNTTGTTFIYEKRLQKADRSAVPADWIELVDWHESESVHKAYGFSKITLATAETSWTVGRLADLFFTARTPLPPAIECALHDIDCNRLLLFNSSHSIPDPNVNQVAIKHRMTRH
ncbi:MAG TPA: GNAT family N-acetyltransferase [Acidobacteriota bacterium]|nr:GNAT family N-acetyltransferase [Acidobacteriota bacterium]